MLELLENPISRSVNFLQKPPRQPKLETISTLAVQRTPIDPKRTVEAVSRLFLSDHELQSIPVLYHETPIGIVYRHQLMDIFLRPFGRDLHGKKPISQFMDCKPLLIEEQTSLQNASQYITRNMRLSATQDFIITRKSQYVGMGTVMDLLEAITALQLNQLRAENTRLSTEIEVTQRLQEMLLPKEAELKQIKSLDIASFIRPAAEVGGDYYDVLCHDGRIIFTMGDVTGHGLESGMVMLMAQAVVRALLIHNEVDQVKFLNTLNQVIYGNVKRMNCDKNLTFVLVDYRDDFLRIIGQHEKIIIVRAGGQVELIDTTGLGFPIGLIEDVVEFTKQTQVPFHSGDTLLLYTDGITEAQDSERKLYGFKQLCGVASRYWSRPASEMKLAIINDVYRHVGSQKIHDDMALLIVKHQ
jgi:sigma-B regulation protein RsbU (phosphoserine phosphatase)